MRKIAVDTDNPPLTRQDLDQVERYLDAVFAKLGIDVEFGRHFLDRVNDVRNGKQITKQELALLFKKEYERYGKPIAQMGPDKEALLTDLSTQLNIPIMLKWDRQTGMLDLIGKTVMRKRNFVPNSPGEKHFKVAKADEGELTYTLKVNDGEGALLTLLNALKDWSSQGHSVSFKIDDQSFGFDGDGADKIYSIEVSNA